MKSGHAFATIEHGQQDGKKQMAVRDYMEGKNIGKKNETTPLQQCIAETRKKWLDKKEKESYQETAPTVTTATTVTMATHMPMTPTVTTATAMTMDVTTAPTLTANGVMVLTILTILTTIVMTQTVSIVNMTMTMTMATTLTTIGAIILAILTVLIVYRDSPSHFSLCLYGRSVMTWIFLNAWHRKTPKDDRLT